LKLIRETGGSEKAALEDFIRELESHSSLGHYQDMNVIGAGPGDDEPLGAGMVFAIEPVLYSKQQNFAVFIEDVVLVTDSGYDVLSRGMPYTVDEVETVMRQKSIIEAADHR
jgi:Xaa-Pro aminopeptidase